MKKDSLIYDGRTFSSEEQMIVSLLEEANRQIIKLDLGRCENNIFHRNYIKFRLVHLQCHFGDYIPVRFRDIYNSLWSHPYRLEYQSGYQNPYLRELLTHLVNQNFTSDKSEEKSTDFHSALY